MIGNMQLFNYTSPRLLSKLHNIGINNSVLKLLKSYLLARLQYTRVNGTLSSRELVKRGVPQDTSVSPLLFNVQVNYINALHCLANLSVLPIIQFLL